VRDRVYARFVGLLACARTDARLLLRVLGWRIVLPILKRVIPVRTLAGWMSAGQRHTPAGSLEPRRARLEALRQMLTCGGRIVMSGNCLERSLVLYRFLAEVGAEPQLVMGVNAAGGTVGGHAWIELDGEPLEEAPASRFAPVVAFGANGTPQRARAAS
jgi:hypothetical protein